MAISDSIVTSAKQPLEHYTWGKACQAWTLLNDDHLAIKQESIPVGAGEQLHYHGKAQQFFYVLQGEAVFEVDETVYIVRRGQGIHIKPGQIHRVSNPGTQELMLLVCSQPATDHDRFNVT